MRQQIIFICAGVVVVMSFGCSLPFPPGFRHESGPIEQSVDFQGARQFEAELQNGSIAIEGWDQSTASMSARVWAKAYSDGSAKRLAESTKVDLKRVGDRVTLVCSPAIPLLQNEQIGVSVLVHLPSSAATTAETQCGDVSAAGLAGMVELSSSCGNIKLTATQGPANCRTKCGDIRLFKPQAAVDCWTGCGKIELTEPAGPVKCKTACGDIILTDPRGPLDCCTGCGNVKLFIGDGAWMGKDIKLDTRCGDVSIDMITR